MKLRKEEILLLEIQPGEIPSPNYYSKDPVIYIKFKDGSWITRDGTYLNYVESHRFIGELDRLVVESGGFLEQLELF